MSSLKRYLVSSGIVALGLAFVLWTKVAPADAKFSYQVTEHLVQPGDTWLALAWRYGIPPDEIRAANPHPNPNREPVVGSLISINVNASGERTGILATKNHGGLLQLAAVTDAHPWSLARLNLLGSPFRPLLYRTIFIPRLDGIPRQYPPGMNSIDFAPVPSRPGRGLALRGEIDKSNILSAELSGIPFALFVNENRILGLAGTGAFFPPGDHTLTITAYGEPAWSQPWRMTPGEWSFDQITLTGSAASIDQESIRLERARLDEIWNKKTHSPGWRASFEMPARDFLGISSDYGARRSYNGGPYNTYHEGVDYSAYGGTSVYAPAAGQVVLAEFLYVRGGAVIIDHGLTVFSGVYHLSELLVNQGEYVEAGQLIGRVGSTGLSTGNHLHWDLLVNGVWVDGLSWLEDNLACWVLVGWGLSCDG